MKDDQKQEEVSFSLEETQTVNSQKKPLDENEMLENKARITDGQLAQKENQEKLGKRDVENKRKKRGQLTMLGIPKPLAGEIGATKERKQRKGTHAKKTKKLQKTQPKIYSKSQMCDKKYLEKKRLRLKVKAAKLKEQRSQIKKVKERANNRKFKGKYVREKEIRTSSGENSRDTECIDKWAAYTNVGLGLAPNVIKQVTKFLFKSSHSFRSIPSSPAIELC